MSKRYLIYGAVSLVFVAICVIRLGYGGKEGAEETGDISAHIGGDFSLTDQDGNVFNLENHRGKIVLLFFGYLSCPDVCPMMLSKLTQVYSALPLERDRILTVFVSVDRERDTPEDIKVYLEYFNINALGSTGSKEEMHTLVQLYKATYKKVDTESAMGYLFNHTDSLYVIDPDGMVRYLIHTEDKKEKIIKAIKSILNENSLTHKTALETGKIVYVTKCMTCHGATGAGDGPTADKVSPKPRNFMSGEFKFTSGPPGSLPTDQDLFKVITEGSIGTAMPSWAALSERERWAVIEYIKSLAPERWKKEKK